MSARERAREKQREQRREMEEIEAGQAGLQAAFQGDEESLKGKYLDSLVKSELDPDRKQILANLLSRDFVLGNLNEEQAHEIKWQLWVIRLKFLAMHPDQDTEVKGVLRASIHDDVEAALQPLSQRERHKVDQFFQGVWSRVTRSTDFKQQEILQSSISESYVQRGDTDDSGDGLLGRFG